MTILFRTFPRMIISMTHTPSSGSSAVAFTVIPFVPDSVPVTLLEPYTVLRTSAFRTSRSVSWNSSGFSLWMTRTVSPPHALMLSESGLFVLTRPSSDTYPSALKSALRAVVASVGIVSDVDSAARYTAPLTAGFPADTLPTVFAILTSLLSSCRSSKCRTRPDNVVSCRPGS